MNHKHIELRRGARLVLQIGKESKHASNTSDEVEAEQLDLEDQRDWAPIETDVATRDQSWEAKLVRCIKALEGRLSGVNRTLNLISAALTRTRMRSGRPFSRRERVSQTWEAVPTVTSKKPAGRGLESGKGAIFGTKQDPKGPAGQTPAGQTPDQTENITDKAGSEARRTQVHLTSATPPGPYTVKVNSPR